MKPRILMVDDDATNLAILSAMLADEGYELHFAQAGDQGWSLAQALRPDLILLDVMMPGINGFDVCRRIRADPVLGSVPIIIVTTLGDSEAKLHALRVGADAFLSKPVQCEELRIRVRTIISLNRFRTIAEQRQRFERLYELAPAAIVLTHRSGRVVAANPQARVKLACPSGRELENDVIFTRFGGKPNESLRSLIEAVRNGETPPDCEIRLGEGESERILNVRTAALPENDDTLAMLIFTDVTATVRSRQALEKMNSELEELVRARTHELEEANALLMSYASFVSHDLRSPLTVMRGYLGLLREGAVRSDPEVAPVIEHAYNASGMMQEMLENILQLARDEKAGNHTGPRPATEAAPIVQRLAMHLRMLTPGVRPRFKFAELPPVGVSAVVVERIFYNIIGNALKYSDSPEPEIEIGGHIDPEGPVIFVRDHGVGFDQRDADKLFQEFSRLPSVRRRTGFGLGLSLVARLIRLYGGRIWARGALGEGATFYVQFPKPDLESGEGRASLESEDVMWTG